MDDVAAPRRPRHVRQSRLLPAISIGTVWLFSLLALRLFAMAPLHTKLTEGLLLILGGGALYLLPGFALLKLIWNDPALAWPEYLALGAGFSIALPPLLLEIAYFIGLPWTQLATFAYIGFALLILGLSTSARIEGVLARLNTLSSWHGRLLVGLLGVGLLSRLFVVRGLPVGMWGDSYQHTMIAQLLVDNSGLFSSWEPYSPLVTFTYHYGFHANVAFLHWLTAIPVPQSVLYVGQILGAVALVMAYLLTVRLTGSRYAGIWAVVLTGFINTMPAYYVNWGRYTQLSGQVLLPVVLVSWMNVWNGKATTWRGILAASIVTASLVLTHYLVAVFAGIFLAALLVARSLNDRSWSGLRRTVVQGTGIASITVLLTAPWLLNILNGRLTRIATTIVNRSSATEPATSLPSLASVTPFFLKQEIILLAIVGLAIAWRRRQWYILLATIWTGLLVFLTIPHVVRLPGTGIVTAFTAYIALYVTVVPIASYALGIGQEYFQRRRPHLTQGVSGAAIVACMGWGVYWHYDLLDPTFQLFTTADEQAMAWIRTETAPSATFLVNMFPAFENSVVVGSDGGWWIPLLTGRNSTLPPLNYSHEMTSPPNYLQRVNAFAATLREHPLPSDEGIRQIREAGIDYVYTGAHVGQDDPIDVAALRGHPAFSVVYDQDDVVIFRVEG